MRDDSQPPSGIDSEEDVIIVHKDVKKSHCLTNTSSDTETCGRQAEVDSYQEDNLLTVNDSREEEDEKEEEEEEKEEEDEEMSV